MVLLSTGGESFGLLLREYLSVGLVFRWDDCFCFIWFVKVFLDEAVRVM